MEVILLDRIDGLGKKGAIVKVKGGYARNYLLPQNKAMRVTPDSLFRLRTLQKKFEEEETALVKELSGVAGRLNGLSLTMVLKATEEGHLFGSVTPGTIVSALAEEGFEVKERGVRLSEPIKSVGTWPVHVVLYGEVTADISVVVDREGGMPEPEGAAAEPEGEAAEGEAAEGEAKAEAKAEAGSEGAEAPAEVPGES